MSNLPPVEASWWRVEVMDGNGQIVAIEPKMLAGRDIGDVEEAAIVRAAEHLLSFAGYHYTMEKHRHD